jgi:hypothetical protein
VDGELLHLQFPFPVLDSSAGLFLPTPRLTGSITSQVIITKPVRPDSSGIPDEPDLEGIAVALGTLPAPRWT